MDTIHEIKHMSKRQSNIASTLDDELLSEAIRQAERSLLHLKFEALLRVRDAQRRGRKPYPFPVTYPPTN